MAHMNPTSLLRRPQFCVIALAACVAMQSGCNIFRPKPETPDAKAPPVPVGNRAKPSPDELVRYLNAQAGLVQSMEARDISLTARAQGSSPPTLDGTLLVQKPKYFKLTGKFLGSQEVLVGSNEERFWFYIPRAQDALYHCSYTDFEKGVELPFPFDPEWVLEALGMAQIGKNTAMRVDEDKTTYRLVEEATLHGQKVRKVTVFYKGPAEREQPQVKARIVYDERDKVICMATVKSVSRVLVDKTPDGRPVYATVPQAIKLEWPAQDTELVLDLGKVKINGQLSMESFQMPRTGSKQVDLGRDRPTGRGVVPAARFR
jgi:hypothetical protein